MNGYARAELDRVLGGDRIRTPKTTQTGGESDPFRSHSRRDLRRLTGAGYLVAGGLSHDEAADWITDHVPGIENPDDAIDWYVRTALEAIDEARRDRNAAIYARRKARAIALGWRSFWHRRKSLEALRETL